jgi:hypothetical protein
METVIQEIKDTDRLLRRCRFADPSYVKDDMSVTSFAFKLRKSETGLSVDIERLTTYKQSIKDPLQYRLFSLFASQIRGTGADCIHKPLTDNYAHAEIIGSITNSIASKLAKVAVFVNYPSTK